MFNFFVIYYLLLLCTFFVLPHHTFFPLDLRSLLYDNRQFYFVVAFSHPPWPFGRYIDFFSDLLKFPVGLACWLFFLLNKYIYMGPMKIAGRFCSLVRNLLSRWPTATCPKSGWSEDCQIWKEGGPKRRSTISSRCHWIFSSIGSDMIWHMTQTAVFPSYNKIISSTNSGYRLFFCILLAGSWLLLRIDGNDDSSTSYLPPWHCHLRRPG